MHFDFKMCYGARFFDISTSKSGPNMVCFVHFDLDMCFTPQRHATYHLSSGQSWVEAAHATGHDGVSGQAMQQIHSKHH